MLWMLLLCRVVCLTFHRNWTMSSAIWRPSSAALLCCLNLRKSTSRLNDILMTGGEVADSAAHHGSHLMVMVGSDRCHIRLKDILMTGREVADSAAHHGSHLMLMVGSDRCHIRLDDVTQDWVRDSVVAHIGRIKHPEEVETSFGTLMMTEHCGRQCGRLSVAARGTMH